MRTRNALRACGWMVLLGPLVVSATAPEAPPYHSYRVSGKVLKPGGEPMVNAAVALATNCGENGEYRLLRRGESDCACTREDIGNAVALTDGAGSFYLDVATCQGLDSLAVAVVEPDGRDGRTIRRPGRHQQLHDRAHPRSRLSWSPECAWSRRAERWSSA